MLDTAAPQETVAAQADRMRRELLHELKYRIARLPEQATADDWLTALCLVVRHRLVDALLATHERRRGQRLKKVYYLSLEFLVGRSLIGNLLSLGLLEGTRQAMASLGLDLDEIAEREHDAALGNGGLGRLAACFMESLATLDFPAMGCGIKYDYGLFKQAFDGPAQVELPDFWDGDRSPWLIERNDESLSVPLYGHVSHETGPGGGYRPRWHPDAKLVGIPHDMPIIGYGGRTANVLRLYAARASDTFDMHIFNRGDYIRAVQQKIESETVSKVLYPSDAVDPGRELRLVQEYFLVACSLHDIVGEFLAYESDFARFPDRVAIQMNDTHPALAIAELMRLLVDVHAVGWDDAWDITRRSCAYTNHTLLPEALEKWPVDLMERVLPRHMQIIYEINARFLAEARARWSQDDPRIARVSLIEEGPQRQVRMAHLAIVGSHSVNGVAQLHSELVKRELVPEFHALMPGRFNNKTNGITPRRWLLQANPGLAALLNDALGSRWVTQLEALGELEQYAGDPAFMDQLRAIKHANKERLASTVSDIAGTRIDPASIYDVQVKRVHEYKRQLLHILHVIHLHIRLTEHGEDIVPRTHLFAGKAAPGYAAAKRIIHLIRNVAAVINADPRCRGRLAVVFLPDYKVSLAERIIPAADLSEQISTAGTEASGTGNMKLALNGALTMGTLDGANIEIRGCVGAENFYAFGLDAAQAAALRAGGYRPRDYLLRDPELARVLDALIDGRYAADRGTYAGLHRNLVEQDHYLHLADFRSYVQAQQQAAQDFLQPGQWHRRALCNMARLGHFSSDRTVAEYASQIWGLQGPGPLAGALAGA